ncbi:MAG: hypothetical protein ABI588_05380 [Arenimonas sp.]
MTSRCAVLLLFALLGLASLPAAAVNTTTRGAKVLVVGNSLSYVNHLPALFNSIAAGQDEASPFRADMIGAPGGSLADRWSEGVVAREIESGRWQVLVLQERGGVLACLATPQSREQAECSASLGAHRHFIELASKHGLRVIVLGTWGPDAIWQGKLSRGLHRIVAGTAAEALDAGPLLRDFGKTHASMPMTIDAIGHPSLDASLLVAGALYRQLSGHAPAAVAFETSAPMLPPMARMEADRLLSQQPQLAGDGRITKVEAARLLPLFAAVAAMPAPTTAGK